MDKVLIAVHVVLILAVAFQLYRKQVALRAVFWPALLVKLVAGICLGLLYTYYYPVSDTFAYFRDGARLASLAQSDFREYIGLILLDYNMGSIDLTLTAPRALFLSKITSVFHLFTGGNYWTIALYFSFISFLASWRFVQDINWYFPKATLAAVAAFLFLPSAVFWSSGLLKESLAIASLLVLCSLALRVWCDDRLTWRHLVLAVLALWIVWNLKYFYAGIFLPVVCAALFCKRFISRRFSAGIEALIWTGVFLLPLVVVSFLHPNFHFDRLLTVVVVNNSAYTQLSDPGDYVRFSNLTPTLSGVLLNTPQALFSGLFRPLPWEVNSAPQLLAGFENAILLFFFAGALLRIKAYATSPHRLLVLAVVVYIVLLCVFLTLSAPNFGTLSRYRVGYITFFTFLILCSNPVLEYVERSFARLARN